MAYERDVWAYLDSMGTDLSTLAKELRCSYHQLYELAHELGAVDENHVTGSRIRLHGSSADTLRDAVNARSKVEQHAVPLGLAATMLDLELNDVQTLVAEGVLELVDVPGAKRLRHVTAESIEAFNRRHPQVGEAQTAEPSGAFVAMAKLMGVSRPTLGLLVRTRRVRATTRGRQQRISLSSAMGWAVENGREGLAATLRDMIDAASRR